MRVTKEEAIGLIIDMQERLLPAMSESEEVLNKCRIFAEGLKILGVPFLFTQQYTKGLGETVAPLKSIPDNFEYIEKVTFSCYDEPRFDVQISAWKPEFIIVAGIEAHVCVQQTVIDLLSEGYKVMVLADAITSRSMYDKKFALKRMSSEGAIITTVESVLFDMLKKAGSIEFKGISALVK